MMTRILLSVAALLAAVGAALAVGPAAWNHATEADFTTGTLENVVVSSLGEVTLSRALETLLSEREDLGMISALATDAQGKVFFSAAPGATVYALEGAKAVKFASPPGALARALVFVKDDLYAGVSGKGAGLYRIDPKGAAKALWTDPAVKSVWAVLPAAGGGFYVGTGPEGRVFEVAADGKATLLHKSDDDNVLCLATGRGGLLFAGTGENGLVIEIDPAKRKGRILYDAAEKEISALVVDAEGVIYAATSDVSKVGGAMPPSEVGPPRPMPTPTGPSKAPIGGTAPAGMGVSSGAGAGGKVRPGGGEAAATASSGVAPSPGTRPASSSAPVGPPVPSTRAAGVSAAPMQVIRTAPPAPTISRGPSGPSGPPGEPEPTGNAVYRIDKDGFVRAVFRRPVVILAMTIHAGVLTLGTGHGGQIYAVSLAPEERIGVLAKLDAKDVTCMVADAKGRLVAATSDKAAVLALGKGYAAKGTLISRPLDAGQIARWGTLNVRAEVPAGCAATIATRSGNVGEAKDNTWSEWSPETAANADWVTIASPAGRYLQYRLTLAGMGQTTATVDQVRLVYQVGNLAPVIRTMQVTPGASPKPLPAPPKGDEGEQPLRYRIIQVRADDPNNDTLQYSVFTRRAGRQNWIKLADKLNDPTYAWDTLGTEDGTYEIKVEAGDAPSNPPAAALKAERISRVVVVDNTAPQVTDLAVKGGEQGQASLSGAAADAVSRIKQIAYAIDSNDEWTVLLPTDGVCDSRKEAFATTLKDLKEGAHRIAVKVTDEFNNTGYASVEVTVGK